MWYSLESKVKAGAELARTLHFLDLWFYFMFEPVPYQACAWLWAHKEMMSPACLCYTPQPPGWPHHSFCLTRQPVL